MNKLPQEVFDLIVQHLDVENFPVPLSQYATICRQWQYAVERRVFEKLAPYTNEMPILETVLRNSRRRGYLRSLKYTIKQSCWDRPNMVLRLRRSSQRNAWKKELNLMNELMRLWNLLSLGWGQPLSERAPSMKLCLEISEPKIAKSKNPKDPFFSNSDIPWARMMLPGVKSLSVIWEPVTSRGVEKAQLSHPPWLFSLLATCPSATEVTWRGFEPYIPTTLVAPGYRERMTASLAAASMLENLRHLSLRFDTPDLVHRRQDIRACRQQAPGTLNQVLHKLSQQLVTLHLKGRFLLSPELFWPKLDGFGQGPKSKTSTETAATFWPHLQQIHIEARLASPEGRFYFDPAAKSIHPGGWYVWPVGATDASAAGDLLVRVTRAMLRMPELRRLSVMFPEFPCPYPNPDRVLIRYGRLWTLGWGRKWRKQCHRLGRCVGYHNDRPQPWYWYWNAPCPAEVAANYEEFMARLCETASYCNGWRWWWAGRVAPGRGMVQVFRSHG